MATAQLLDKTAAGKLGVLVDSVSAQTVSSEFCVTDGLVLDPVRHKADPAFGFAQIGKDWYPDPAGSGAMVPTVPAAVRPPKYGGGVWPAWVAGKSTIYTVAIGGPQSRVFLQPLLGGDPADAGAAPLGNADTLTFGILAQDTNPITATGYSIVVYAVLPDTTQCVAPAAGSGAGFNWMIVNPAW